MKLILGSKSPRRKELLSLLGYQFEIRTKDTDESFPPNLLSTEVAQYVAEKKSSEMIGDLKEDEILICADTTVILDEEIIGKPLDREHSIKMLGKLSGRMHIVNTGVVIASLERKVSFNVSTKVYFHPLSFDEIQTYVDTFKPFDKAGSYGIQEWIGCAAIQRIEGSYNNVVGLPTHEIYQALKLFEQ